MTNRKRSRKQGGYFDGKGKEKTKSDQRQRKPCGIACKGMFVLTMMQKKRKTRKER